MQIKCVFWLMWSLTEHFLFIQKNLLAKNWLTDIVNKRCITLLTSWGLKIRNVLNQLCDMFYFLERMKKENMVCKRRSLYLLFGYIKISYVMLLRFHFFLCNYCLWSLITAQACSNFTFLTTESWLKKRICAQWQHRNMSFLIDQHASLESLDLDTLCPENDPN